MTTLFILFSSISYYSTANTPDAAYIIGGWHTGNLVAEFRNDKWAQLDYLNKERRAHASITVGTQMMIVGGSAYGGRLVMILPHYFGYEDSDFFLSFETEVWELETGNNKVITPTLGKSFHSIGLYAVDFNFCSN